METGVTLIVGAGPAGLSAANELSGKGRPVIVLEQDPLYVGGLSRTISFHGHRFDIGGHRYYTKNETITQWWKNRLGADLTYTRRSSSLYFQDTFFTYPLNPLEAFLKLKPGLSMACIISYLKARLSPKKEIKSFADWAINSFGEKLFEIFFRGYTEKVWGVPCEEISAAWADQRIKGASLVSAALNKIRKFLPFLSPVKTFIDYFYFPRLGAGQMWEKTRDDLKQQGVAIHQGQRVICIKRSGYSISTIVTEDPQGKRSDWPAQNFLLSMPLKEAVLCMDPPLPQTVVDAASRLRFRDMIVVPMILNKKNFFPCQWLYISSPALTVGRIQNFSLWSRDLCPDPNAVGIELEFFCQENDSLWNKSDKEICQLACEELAQLRLATPADIIDATVVRVRQTYPFAGLDTEKDRTIIRDELKKFSNLQMMGRNGLHRYNNLDHSMLSGILAARTILGGTHDSWKVNTDALYLEEK